MVAAVSIGDLLLLPALIGYTIWWTTDLRRGSLVRRWTLGLHLVVYALAAFYIWAVSLGEIVLRGAASSPATWLWTIVLTVTGVAATEAGLWYGSRRLVLERTADDRWSYRGPIAIAAFWLGLYVARLGLEDGLLGGFSVFFPTGHVPSGIPVGTFEGVVLVIASLYLVSFGFLLGISIVVWDGTARGSTAPSAPSPDPEVAPRTVASPPSSFAITPPLELPPAAQAVSGGFFRDVSPAGGPPVLSARPGSGAASSVPGVEPAARCPACGTPVRGSWAYCGSCGRTLAGPSKVGPAPPASPAGPESLGRQPSRD